MRRLDPAVLVLEKEDADEEDADEAEQREEIESWRRGLIMTFKSTLLTLFRRVGAEGGAKLTPSSPL